MYRLTPEMADFYDKLKEDLEKFSEFLNQIIYNYTAGQSMVTSDENIILIAPHPDDELIGAYTLLKSGRVDEVWYIKEGIEDEKRREELEEVVKVFELKYRIISWEDLTKNLIELGLRRPGTIVLVPDPRERHPLHRFVTAVAEVVALFKGNITLGYYSTQMNASYVKLLPPDVARAKRDVLLNFYGSQASLFESDHKYWLYEGVVVCLD